MQFRVAPSSASGQLLLSCLVPCWLASSPVVRTFTSRYVLTMPVTIARRRIVETTVSIEQTRRTRRRLSTTLEASTTSESDRTPMKIYKVKQETLDIVEEVKKEEGIATPSKSVRSPQARTPSTPTRQAPKDWESIYELVEELRQDRSAPVDTNGSEALPQRTHGNKTFRFQVLIALMLSSQTKDAVVGETMRALQAHGLNVDSISETSSEVLNALIRKVGFHNNKTKYIKETVELLKSRYDGDIPPNAAEIMTLPGVGPKMAFIVENVAWNTTSGIGVDTHMHRMFNEIKWVNSKNPEQTRKQLESWLPRDRWSTVNVLWVGFGQEVQQFKPKVIRKALDCSRPADALRLLKRLGVDLKKEGEKMGVEEEIKHAMKG